MLLARKFYYRSEHLVLSLRVGRHLSSVLITDNFEFIIIFCGWRGSSLGGGAFFVGMVINYYARR